MMAVNGPSSHELWGEGNEIHEESEPWGTGWWETKVPMLGGLAPGPLTAWIPPADSIQAAANGLGVGDHCSLHALGGRSAASLGYGGDVWKSVSCRRMDPGHISVSGMLFSTKGWGPDGHYSLRDASVISAVTAAGEVVGSAVGISHHGDFHRRKILGDPNVSVYSVVHGIGTRKHIQNSKQTTASEP